VIAYLHGKIAQIDPTYVVIDCGGIGYQAKISLTTYNHIREQSSVKLHTHLQVREDAQVLYGFYSLKEKVLFEQLISISGVGGNTAIMILSSMQVDDFYQAIEAEDIQSLKRIKGIGAKTAGRILLELKDKITWEGSDGSTSGTAASIGQKKLEAVTALSNLGWSKSAMEKRVDQILKQHGPEISVADIIKFALKNP